MTHEPEWLAHLRASVSDITDAPLPSVTGADLALYDELRAIRLAGATTCCLMLLLMVRDLHGPAARAHAQQQLEPIRLHLLQRFPDYADELDSDAWPAPPRRVH